MYMDMIRGRAVQRAGAFVAALLATIGPFLLGCMGRSSLRIGGGDEVPPASSEFCATSEYQSGFRDVSLYMLLDKSSSMVDDDKWFQATAALGAFVSDPAVAGMGFGLQYYPLSSYCNAEPYAVPAIGIRPLPQGAAQIGASLAAQIPGGDTPTLPALRGGIEHARARQIAEPDQAVAVAVVTDGWPNACDSSAEQLVSLAREGSGTEPQVLTFVIGFRTGRLSILDQIAAAGGTGHAVVIGSDGAAQQLVDTLKEVRAGLRECRFSLPPVDQPVVGTDVAVSYRSEIGAVPVVLPAVANRTSCVGDGFYVDDPGSPTEVELCEATCERLHARRDSRVDVTVGCGVGYEPPDAGGGGGSCGGAVSFQCVPGCGQSPGTPPDCEDGLWICPPGTVPTYTCGSCPAVPHRCCQPDGLLAPASCIDGAWACPPGGVLFGEGACVPPGVCAAELPCPAGQYCVADDYSCGEDELPGTCAPLPSTCSEPGDAVCGCDDVVYDSACSAAASGVDLSDAGSCAAPLGRFPCGPYLCRVADQLCRHTHLLGADPAAENSYGCLAIPPGCPTGCGCDLCGPCPPDTTCLESCSTTSQGGRMISCTQL